jgi:phage shock protein A
MSMAKHEQQAERLEREADRLEEQGDRIERHIDDARKDWESKEHDSAVPGAQPKPGEDEEGVAGAEADPEETREQPGP